MNRSPELTGVHEEDPLDTQCRENAANLAVIAITLSCVRGKGSLLRMIR